MEANTIVIVQVAQGAKMCGASKIIGVDLNPEKEKVGKSIFPFAIAYLFNFSSSPNLKKNKLLLLFYHRESFRRDGFR